MMRERKYFRRIKVLEGKVNCAERLFEAWIKENSMGNLVRDF
jgi:hypothetical protein